MELDVWEKYCGAHEKTLSFLAMFSNLVEHLFSFAFELSSQE
jgi:hypothetical protein